MRVSDSLTSIYAVPTVQAGVLSYLKQIHSQYPASLNSALPKIQARPDSLYAWSLVELPAELVRYARWRELWHYHQGFNLMEPGETLDDAVKRWPLLPHGGECSAKIFSLMAMEGSTEPLILGIEPDGTLEHIDGFHRMVAGLIADTDSFVAYLAQPI